MGDPLHPACKLPPLQTTKNENVPLPPTHAGALVAGVVPGICWGLLLGTLVPLVAWTLHTQPSPSYPPKAYQPATLSTPYPARYPNPTKQAAGTVRVYPTIPQGYKIAGWYLKTLPLIHPQLPGPSICNPQQQQNPITTPESYTLRRA